MLGEEARLRQMQRVDMARGRIAKVPTDIREQKRPRAIIVHSKPAGRRLMEAEQQNQIANTLDDVDRRTVELRRYL